MQNRRNFDAWHGADYARQSSLQAAMAAQALSLVDLRGNERVLDIGCGDGRISAQIAQQLVPHGSVCGIDASVDMIDFARLQNADVPNLYFMVVDARELGFHSAFDSAVSFNALHWVPELLPALRGLHKALVPEGRAWLRLVTQGSVESLEAVAEQVRREPVWAPHFAGFEDPYLRLEPDELATLATNAGFRVLNLETRLESWDFGDHAALHGFCSAGFGAWTKRLPEERRARFVDAVIERYVALREGLPSTVFRFYQTSLALQAVPV